MPDRFTLPDFDDLSAPLGAALHQCEEYCVSACCGMEAYNVSVENMQRCANAASAAEVEQARREVEAVLESAIP